MPLSFAVEKLFSSPAEGAVEWECSELVISQTWLESRQCHTFSSFFLLPATKSEKNICPHPIGQHSDSLKFPVAHDVCACVCMCVYVEM